MIVTATQGIEVVLAQVVVPMEVALPPSRKRRRRPNASSTPPWKLPLPPNNSRPQINLLRTLTPAPFTNKVPLGRYSSIRTSNIILRSNNSNNSLRNSNNSNSSRSNHNLHRIRPMVRRWNMSDKSKAVSCKSLTTLIHFLFLLLWPKTLNCLFSVWRTCGGLRCVFRSWYGF